MTVPWPDYYCAPCGTAWYGEIPCFGCGGPGREGTVAIGSQSPAFRWELDLTYESLPWQ